jgi:prepilin-type N-terminal cleavage/methylation domain-containing protein
MVFLETAPMTRPRPRHAQRASGFTLTEVLLALTVLVVAVGGTLGTLNAYVRLDQQTAQRAEALRAAELQIERLQAEPFGDLFERYNGNALDDPAGALPSPGQHFAVPGLDVQPGDADGFVGRILLPEDPAAPGVLREDLVNRELGTPMDLNLDGVIDGADHALDHVLLPVRVEVRWTGPAGMQSVTLDSSIVPR